MPVLIQRCFEWSTGVISVEEIITKYFVLLSGPWSFWNACYDILLIRFLAELSPVNYPLTKYPSWFDDIFSWVCYRFWRQPSRFVLRMFVKVVCIVEILSCYFHVLQYVNYYATGLVPLMVTCATIMQENNLLYSNLLFYVDIDSVFYNFLLY